MKTEKIHIKKEDIKKANRKGNREAFLEGEKFKTLSTKLHKNKKKYSRKDKYKRSNDW